MKRRDFLKTAAVPPAAIAVDQAARTFYNAGLCMGATSDHNAPSVPRRDYGKTGIRLSVIGFGGYMLHDMEQREADRLVAQAIERGVNYFDVAPTYGNAERQLGPALQPYRKNVFLACKTTQRTKEGAEAELKASLERLRTDHFDLYQLHAINDVKKDVEVVFGKGGAMEVFIEARKSGKIRHIGFSSHTVEAPLAAMDRYDFDSALFPVNFACWYKGNFGPQVLAKAASKGVAVLALKAMARQKWPENDPNRGRYARCWYQPLTDLKEAELGLRFALSQGITAAVSPAEAAPFLMALRLVGELNKPLTAEEVQTLKALADQLNPIFTSKV
jgi:aryl-alcohol dehydrogenase-like predicted oxidoreductase